MNSHTPSNLPPQQPGSAQPGAAQPLVNRAAQQLQHWQQLRDQLQSLHAELEYLRLMLKLDAQKQ
jgi:hypothetical protein